MKQVIIASQNPVKINAVEQGFSKMFPKESFDFQGISLHSGINDQPMNNQETLEGASTRVENAVKTYPDADFWVGIEGGVEKEKNAMTCSAWIIIKSKDKVGKAKSGTFTLPSKIIELINQGKELGEANDLVFNKHNSKQKNGSVGMLTDNVIDRTSYYLEPVILALIPFKNQNLY